MRNVGIDGRGVGRKYFRVCQRVPFRSNGQSLGPPKKRSLVTAQLVRGKTKRAAAKGVIIEETDSERVNGADEKIKLGSRQARGYRSILL